MSVTAELHARGKVRDIYEAGPDSLVMVASDRISAFDVVLPTPIPRKGQVLTGLSLFWFEQVEDLVANHVLTEDFREYPEGFREPDLAGRAMLVRRAEVVPIECVARGYLSGSGWKEYQRSGTVCGIKLPAGLVESDRLPQPIFTPSTKATEGHDENITIEQAGALVGEGLARKLEELTLSIYERGAEIALQRGIILADTKFEFGFADGELILIDEVMTPDSSRFWPADQYEPGHGQPSYDKQFVRDWLEESDWNKEPPGPELPDEVVQGTSSRYCEAYVRITQEAFQMYLKRMGVEDS